MHLILLKCAICNTWYSPDAHHGHCFNCGAHPMKLEKGMVKYYSLKERRMIELVSGLPNHLRATTLNTMVTK